jgi:tetratricopeptide (TPR) repeat protein
MKRILDAWLGFSLAIPLAVAGWCSLAAAQPADSTSPPPADQRDSGDKTAKDEVSAQEAKELVNAAYEKGKSAQSIEELTPIIDMVRRARRGTLTPANEQYARQLLSWTYNRRGEARSKAAAEADANGESSTATALEAEALADYEESVRLDATRWKAFHNRGVSYALLGKYEMALEDFGRTIALNARHPNAWFNRAEIHFQLGRHNEAIRDYSESIRLNPTDAAAYAGRGGAYYRMGRFRDALADFDQAVRAAPQNPAPLVHRGDAFADLGNWPRAAEDYRAALRLDGEHGAAWLGQAWLMATCPDERFRDAEQALAAARKAMALDGQIDYRHLDTLAAALAANGQYDEAREAIAKAIAAAPEDMADRLKAREALYEKNQPFRQASR